MTKQDIADLVMKFLVEEKGFDVNAKDDNNWTLLHYAARKGYSGTAEMLIQYGADINTKTIQGKTPLHWAALNNKYNVIKILMKYGADINIKDNNNATALFLSKCDGESSKVFNLLKKYGAKE